MAAIQHLLLPLFWLCCLALQPTLAAAENSRDENSPSAPAPDKPAEKRSPAELRVLPDVSHKRQQSVVTYLEQFDRSDERVTLLANNEPFGGLFLSESQGTPQGAALILPDSGQHEHWPQHIAPLREQLPASGWSTLSIELPTPPAIRPPPRPQSNPSGSQDGSRSSAQAAQKQPATTGDRETEATRTDTADNTGLTVSSQPQLENSEAAESTASEPPLPHLTELPAQAETGHQGEPPAPSGPAAEDIYRAAVQARIRQAVSYLHQRGLHNLVIIASGSSAAWAAHYLGESTSTDTGDGEDNGYALVLIDATEHRLSHIPLNQQLTALDIPVLDLVSPAGIAPLRQVNRRAGQMRHHQKKNYQQIHLPAAALPFDDNSLLFRRLRGWLKTHVAGTELPAS